MAIIVHLWKTLQHNASVSNMSLAIRMVSNAALLEVPNHPGCLRTVTFWQSLFIIDSLSHSKLM
jgi:hypothetical protein